MQRLSARVVVVALAFSLLILPASGQQQAYVSPGPGSPERYEYIDDSYGDAFGQAMVHYPSWYSDQPDWAYIEIWSGEIEIEIGWSPSMGAQVWWIYYSDGEFIYPDLGQMDTVESLGLAPLPGIPPCNGDDCNQCINTQLTFCKNQAKADLAVASAAYVTAMGLCIGGLVLGPAGPGVTLGCALAASGVFVAAAYKIRQTKRQCEYDRPRQYCHHMEDGSPCLPQ